MDEIASRVEALRTGKRYNCAQVVAAMLLEDAGQDSTLLANALRGFGGGLTCGKICGCVTGGAAGLNALVQQDGVEGKRECGLLNKRLALWFEETYGSTECDVIKHPANGGAPPPCPVLMAETYAQCAKMRRAPATTL